MQERIWPENNWTLGYYVEVLDETVETGEARERELGYERQKQRQTDTGDESEELEEYEKLKAERQKKKGRSASDESVEL